MLAIMRELARYCSREAVRLTEPYSAQEGFDDSQVLCIARGFDDGLTEEQVALYAKPAFNSNQMCEIREGFEAGLTIEQVRTYARVENGKALFDSDQMYEIREGL